MSYESIDNAIWKTELYLMKKYGTNAAQTDVAPLKWYIKTGRAPLYYLRLLIKAKPFMVARTLHDAPSYDKAIEKLKNYLESIGKEN